MAKKEHCTCVLPLSRCRYCDHCSITSTGRASHELSHTGERPFACTLCPYRSKQKCTLIAHEQRHAKRGGGSIPGPLADSELGANPPSGGGVQSSQRFDVVYGGAGGFGAPKAVGPKSSHVLVASTVGGDLKLKLAVTGVAKPANPAARYGARAAWLESRCLCAQCRCRSGKGDVGCPVMRRFEFCVRRLLSAGVDVECRVVCAARPCPCDRRGGAATTGSGSGSARKQARVARVEAEAWAGERNDTDDRGASAPSAHRDDPAASTGRTALQGEPPGLRLAVAVTAGSDGHLGVQQRTVKRARRDDEADGTTGLAGAEEPTNTAVTGLRLGAAACDSEAGPASRDHDHGRPCPEVFKDALRPSPEMDLGTQQRPAQPRCSAVGDIRLGVDPDSDARLPVSPASEGDVDTVQGGDALDDLQSDAGFAREAGAEASSSEDDY